MPRTLIYQQTAFPGASDGAVPASDCFSDLGQLPPDIAHNEHQYPISADCTMSTVVVDSDVFSNTFEKPVEIAHDEHLWPASQTNDATSGANIDSDSFSDTQQCPPENARDEHLWATSFATDPSADVFDMAFFDTNELPTVVSLVDWFAPVSTLDVSTAPPDPGVQAFFTTTDMPVVNPEPIWSLEMVEGSPTYFGAFAFTLSAGPTFAFSLDAFSTYRFHLRSYPGCA